MADNYISGTSGLVTIGSTNYSFAKWRIAIKSGLPKVTNFNSTPYQLLVAGILSSTVTLEGPYNQGNMAFTAGVSYVWILKWTPSISLTITGFIEELTPDDDADGSPRVNITIQSSGSFTASIT